MSTSKSFADAWQDFLIHVEFARNYPAFYRVTQMHVREPRRHPLLDVQLPTLLHVKAVAMLDDGLEQALTAASVVPSAFGQREDLNGRIRSAERSQLLTAATTRKLHAIRQRRNDMAHDVATMQQWCDLDADLPVLHGALAELGLVGVWPTLSFSWSRTPKGQLQDERAVLGFHYRLAVARDGVEAMEMVWAEEILPFGAEEDEEGEPSAT